MKKDVVGYIRRELKMPSQPQRTDALDVSFFLHDNAYVLTYNYFTQKCYYSEDLLYRSYSYLDRKTGVWYRVKRYTEFDFLLSPDQLLTNDIEIEAITPDEFFSKLPERVVEEIKVDIKRTAEKEGLLGDIKLLFVIQEHCNDLTTGKKWGYWHFVVVPDLLLFFLGK